MRSLRKLLFSVPFLAMGLAVALPKTSYHIAMAAPISKDSYQLRGSTATLTWGVYDYGAGLAGFESGNILEATDTLNAFIAPSEGDYRVVFHYFAGAYPNATAPKRLLNFLVNGRQNIRALTIDSSNDWSVPHSEEFYLHLDKGENTIVLQGEHGPDSCVNADKVEVFDPSNGLLATLEAEDGILNNTGIPAPGIVAGFENRNRPAADISVTASKAGLYTLGINYAGGPNGTAPEVRSLNIGVNADGRANGYTKIDFNATGDWGVYALKEFDLHLEEGVNVITIQSCPGLDSYQSSLNLTDLYVSLSGYQQALDFSNDYLLMDIIPTTDPSVTPECASRYSDAKAAFANLYDEGKASFLTNEDFQNARNRLAAWAKANGEEFDSSTGLLSVSSIMGANGFSTSSDDVAATLAIGTIALGAGVTLVFAKRRHSR